MARVRFFVAAFDRGFAYGIPHRKYGRGQNPYSPDRRPEMHQAWDAGFGEAELQVREQAWREMAHG